MYLNDPVEARYQRDPWFKNLVDMLYAQIAQHKLSPTEIREAAMLAAVKFEMTHHLPFVKLSAEELRWQEIQEEVRVRELLRPTDLKEPKR